MRFTFKKGKHGSRPRYWLRWFPYLIKPFRITRRVMFTQESKYTLEGTHQENRNKMVGISFYIDRHRCSTRFCWRHNPTENNFIISAYCYINGTLHMQDMISVPAMHWYECRLLLSTNEYRFYIFNERGDEIAKTAMSKGHNRKSGWLLGPFFGGAMPAPKKVSIELKKAK